jgi:hypothetical protein
VQAEIVAIIGSDHELVAQQAYRIAVDVFGRMHDTDLGHVSLT